MNMSCLVHLPTDDCNWVQAVVREIIKMDFNVSPCIFQFNN